MNIQYKQVVVWDSTLIDVGFLGSEQSVPIAIRGLACNGVKITSGAPSAVAGYWIPGATIINAVTGVQYKNTGSTASPVWTVVPTSAALAPFNVVLAGTASGLTGATRAYTVTGLLATDIVSGVIRASTNAVEIQKVTASANTLTVLFSGDPGASTTVDYIAVRAA